MYKPKLKIVTKVGRSVVNIDKKKVYIRRRDPNAI